MSIKLIDVAKYYSGLEHQDDALDWLEDKILPKVLDEFARRYREDPLLEEQKLNKEYVTKSQLAHIWVCAESLITDDEVRELNRCLAKFDITNFIRIRHFLAQTGHESGGGKWKTELSDGKYLRGRTDLGHGPYEGEHWKGAGYLQVTGKYNYKRLGDYLQDPKVVQEGYQYVADNYPFTSAGFWWMDNNMNALCDTYPTVTQVTLKVNGGTNGLADREAYFRRATEVIHE